MLNYYMLYRGSWYINLSFIGKWVDFIGLDFVFYIDKNYWIIVNRDSRGVVGYFMGG